MSLLFARRRFVIALSGVLDFPLKHGYACGGRVIGAHPPATTAWRDRLVFAFYPCESLGHPPDPALQILLEHPPP